MQLSNVQFVIGDIGVRTSLIYNPDLETVTYNLVGRTTADTLLNKTIPTDDNNILGAISTGYYGNGALGNVVLSNGSSDLGSDSYYNNLTLNNYVLNSKNNRIFVRDTLTLNNNSILCNDANDAVGSTGGVAIGNQTSHPLAPSIGGGGGTTTNGVNGGTIPANTRIGGTGGAGGSGSSGTGGNGGTATVITTARGGTTIFNALPNAILGRALDNTLVNGGGGGGGGAGNGAAAGGGGGAGAGGLIISAKYIVSDGSSNVICSNGGNGANGLASGCGGGGGGGGGYVNIFTQSIDSSIVVIARGGFGGAGLGAGANGSNGAVGRVSIILNN